LGSQLLMQLVNLGAQLAHLTVESLDRDHQHTMGIHHRDSGIAFAQPEGCMPILEAYSQAAKK
jgi:hypothetical protein